MRKLRIIILDGMPTSGKTIYSKKEIYLLSGRFHFRFGVYRDLMKKPMTAYFDEYGKKRLN